MFTFSNFQFIPNCQKTMAFEKSVLSIVAYGLYLTCVTSIAFIIHVRHDYGLFAMKYITMCSDMNNIKYKRTDALLLLHQQQSTTVDIHGPLQTRGETRCPGGVSVSCLASRTGHEYPRHNKGYIWRLDTGCGPTLYRKCHIHNTPGNISNTFTQNNISLIQILFKVNMRFFFLSV